MNLNQKLVAAVGCGGYLGDLTTKQARLLLERGHAVYVASTGRWLLTDAGVAAAKAVDAELTVAELAEIGSVR